MTGPDPAVQAVRLAVRRGLLVIDQTWSPSVRTGGVVMVACSGGADSLALLAATVFELRRVDARVVGAVVDHGLQRESAAHTARVVEQMAGLGVDETASIRVTVDPGPAGIEAGARQARYAALDRLAQHFGADVVLLGHTLDDQAETVLMGLARGSGGRSLSGMRRGFYVTEPEPVVLRRHADGHTERIDPTGPSPAQFTRPLLEVTRAQTEAACRADGIDFWVDPHNDDPRFLRSRVRHTVMPLLEREMGPGVAAALARTGHQLRGDMDDLDGLAERLGDDHDFRAGANVWHLEAIAPALSSRLLRRAAVAAGCPPSDLTSAHIQALEGLVDYRDERHPHRSIDLPGGVRAVLDGSLLRLEPPPPTRESET